MRHLFACACRAALSAKVQLSQPHFVSLFFLPQGLPVAVKTIIFSSHMMGGAKSQHVLMEAALSKSISHPHVVITYNCDLQPVAVSLTCYYSEPIMVAYP